jgi:hypothetical protein
MLAADPENEADNNEDEDLVADALKRWRDIC